MRKFRDLEEACPSLPLRPPHQHQQKQQPLLRVTLHTTVKGVYGLSFFGSTRDFAMSML